MKKTYTMPTVEIIKYTVEDVLLASGMLRFLSEKVEKEDSASVLAEWLNS